MLIHWDLKKKRSDFIANIKKHQQLTEREAICLIYFPEVAAKAEVDMKGKNALNVTEAVV